ncbi:MAG: hypothetical protein QM723_30030 [Myxococcaceae bacterium]
MRRWKIAVASLPFILLVGWFVAIELNTWRACDRLIDQLNSRAKHWSGDGDGFEACVARLPEAPGWNERTKRVIDVPAAEAWTTQVLRCAWPLPPQPATPATSAFGERGRRWWTMVRVLAGGLDARLARLQKEGRTEDAALTCAQLIAMRTRFNRAIGFADYLTPAMDQCETLAAAPEAEAERTAAREALVAAPSEAELITDWAEIRFVYEFGYHFSDEQSKRLAVPLDWNDGAHPGGTCSKRQRCWLAWSRS